MGNEPMTSEERRRRIEELSGESDLLRRRLKALALLTERLSQDGIEPILVGGLALEFYTAGGYSTGDVDLALPAAPEVDAAFAELGFAKEGRFWVRPDLDLYIEAPAPADLPGEEAPRTRVEIDGLPVVIVGVEDLLLDRVRAWVHWKSDEDGRWSRRLAALYADRIDWDYVLRKTEDDEEEKGAVALLQSSLRELDAREE